MANISMWPPQKGEYILVSKHEYFGDKDRLKIMYDISHKLFDAYYGKDYYLPISGSAADVYEYLANELIKDLEKRKKNIFVRLWQKITKW